MKTVWRIVFLMEVAMFRVTSADSIMSGEVYPFAFMNITTDREEEGFVQLFCYSINQTSIRVNALSNTLNQFAIIGTVVNNKFNMTSDFDQEHFVSDVVATDTTETDQLGIVTSSSNMAYVIGVKSDRGSTDAFLALPLMRQSTEFIVAGWPYNPPFYASCVIVPAVGGTCVEVYKINGDGSYVLLGEGSLSQFEVLRYYADLDLDANGGSIPDTKADMTGYFINATKPIQVICGHECANVPEGLPFCDHMSEQIPPINQLGRFHVVPPIYGRSPTAGYVVRVVATEANTSITSMGLSVRRNRGMFVQLNTSDWKPIVVVCDKPCLVMQYNKGRRAADSDVPTDPFMTLVVPSDRFTSGAGFATPNYCDVAKVRIVFDNWVSIVTFAAYRDSVLFDGQPVLTQSSGSGWDLTSVPGFAVIGFRITHDFHFVSCDPGSVGSFAVYVYGHSILTTSSSAYGFSANYNITGDPVTDVWVQSQDAFNQYLENLKNGSCTNESTLIDPILGEDEHVSFPFDLSVSFDAVSISDSCIQNFYNPSIYDQLTEFTHVINQWICLSSNCSYLNGWGVALNYNTLSVSFLQDTQGNYNGLLITVEMIASLDTGSSGFGTCRSQIKDFMKPFVNWPSRTLFPTRGPPGCPWPLNFSQQAFTVGEHACPVK